MMILPNNLQFILWDKINKRQANVGYYIDEEGELWVDTSNHPCMSGNRTIRPVGTDDVKYELKVINKHGKL